MGSKPCDPEDIALKSFFLGPKAENGPWVIEEIEKVLTHWIQWRRDSYPEDGSCISANDRQQPEFMAYQEKLSTHLLELMQQLEGELPVFSPRYIGHMISEISLPALFGHIAALLRNANNISGEVSRVGLKLEEQAIAFLATMVGGNAQTMRGHFTSGGTVANFEALWRARYALDHWLALGAYLVEQRLETMTLFAAAHMGWEQFDLYVARHGIAIDALRDYSLVASNPFQAVKKINMAFKVDYLGPVILVPASKHYSWQKGVSLLGFGEDSCWTLDLDARGKLCLDSLKVALAKAQQENRPVLMVTSVLGTTELGEFDPVHDVSGLLDEQARDKQFHIWHHVDAAYGGFFCTLLGDAKGRQCFSSESLKALEAVKLADSITLDPHKLGYVPYACGAILVKDERHYLVSQFSAPYIDANHESNIWLKTLEGSRSATGAAATWMTAKTIGFHAQGYGRILARTVNTKKKIEQELQRQVPDCRLIPHCDSNVLCFCIAAQHESLSVTNQRSLKIYEMIGADHSFFASKTALTFQSYGRMLKPFIDSWQGKVDDNQLVLVRFVIMNPFFSSKENQVDYTQDLIKRLQMLIKVNPDI